MEILGETRIITDPEIYVESNKEQQAICCTHSAQHSTHNWPNTATNSTENISLQERNQTW